MVSYVVRPQVIISPSSTTVVIGQSAKLICEILGTNLTYRWMKDNTVVSNVKSNILIINSTNESDAGMYKCVAGNIGGMAESDFATVNVYGECRKPNAT